MTLCKIFCHCIKLPVCCQIVQGSRVLTSQIENFNSRNTEFYKILTFFTLLSSALEAHLLKWSCNHTNPSHPAGVYEGHSDPGTVTNGISCPSKGLLLLGVATQPSWEILFRSHSLPQTVKEGPCRPIQPTVSPVKGEQLCVPLGHQATRVTLHSSTWQTKQHFESVFTAQLLNCWF